MTGQAQTWRVEVDRDRCMGAGACAYALPRVFTVGEDGKAKVDGAVREGEQETVREVVAECPTAALRLVPDSASMIVGQADHI